MPFHFKKPSGVPNVEGLQSVLIVPCRFCPAMSLAVTENKPYMELLRRFLRTEAYETYIRDLRTDLEDRGIQASVFDSKWPHHMVTCMWPSSRRKELADRAAEFDGVLVLGCDAMVDWVSQSLKGTKCRVIQGLEAEGIMNVIPTLSFPLNIQLSLQGVTPMRRQIDQDPIGTKDSPDLIAVEEVGTPV